MVKIGGISVYFDIFEVYATGNTAQLDFCGGYELSQIFSTSVCYWFDLRTTLESTLRKWWKFEHFRFILIILKVHARGNTAQLGFCERYELSHVPANTLILSVRPGNHFEIIYLEKMVRVRAISVHFDHFWKHCSVGLLWGLQIGVLPTPIYYWFDLRTILESYALRENDKRLRKNSKYHFTGIFYEVFFCAFSLT